MNFMQSNTYFLSVNLDLSDMSTESLLEDVVIMRGGRAELHATPTFVTLPDHIKPCILHLHVMLVWLYHPNIFRLSIVHTYIDDKGDHAYNKCNLDLLIAWQHLFHLVHGNKHHHTQTHCRGTATRNSLQRSCHTGHYTITLLPWLDNSLWQHYNSNMTSYVHQVRAIYHNLCPS